MKLQVLANEQDEIKGYTTFLLKDLNVLSEKVANNECEFILASDTLNLFSEEELFNFLGLLLNKLRINGELTVGGIDQRLFCKHVLNNLIDSGVTNKIILGSKSMVDLETVKKFLVSNGLKIQHSKISGLSYEISATRR